MSKKIVIISKPDATDQTCNLLYSMVYDSFCVKGIEGSSMYKNDGKCNGADFWGVDKARSNSFLPCDIVVEENDLVKDGELYIASNGIKYVYNTKFEDGNMIENVIIELHERIKNKLLEGIFRGDLKDGSNVDKYFEIPKFETTEQKTKKVLEDVIKYCEDKEIYDKLTMHGDFYYKAKQLLKNMK